MSQSYSNPKVGRFSEIRCSRKSRIFLPGMYLASLSTSVTPLEFHWEQCEKESTGLASSIDCLMADSTALSMCCNCHRQTDRHIFITSLILCSSWQYKNTRRKTHLNSIYRAMHGRVARQKRRRVNRRTRTDRGTPWTCVRRRVSAGRGRCEPCSTRNTSDSSWWRRCTARDRTAAAAEPTDQVHIGQLPTRTASFPHTHTHTHIRTHLHCWFTAKWPLVS